jgi:hypothetical protein
MDLSNVPFPEDVCYVNFETKKEGNYFLAIQGLDTIAFYKQAPEVPFELYTKDKGLSKVRMIYYPDIERPVLVNFHYVKDTKEGS